MPTVNACTSFAVWEFGNFSMSRTSHQPGLTPFPQP